MYLSVIAVYKGVVGLDGTVVSIIIFVMALIVGAVFIGIGFTMAALPFLDKGRKRSKTKKGNAVRKQAQPVDHDRQAL